MKISQVWQVVDIPLTDKRHLRLSVLFGELWCRITYFVQLFYSFCSEELARQLQAEEVNAQEPQRQNPSSSRPQSSPGRSQHSQNSQQSNNNKKVFNLLS